MGGWGFQTRSQASRVAMVTREVEGQQTQPRGHRRGHSRVRQIRRFEMVDELLLPQSGEGEANVLWLDWDGSQLVGGTSETTVTDSMRMHTKMATEGSDVGAYGLAWVPDVPLKGDPHNTTWEILTMQTPGNFMGRLQTELTTGIGTVEVEAFRPSGSGHITFDGYDPFGDGWIAANGGRLITVYNPPAQWDSVGETFDAFMHEGDQYGVVFCKWFARLARYYIYHVECAIDLTESLKLSWFYES